MDKTIAGLLGAVAALGTVASAEAMPVAVPFHVLGANSYAELLEPIDKASEFLRSLDEQRAARADEGRAELARYRHHYRRRHYLSSPKSIFATDGIVQSSTRSSPGLTGRSSIPETAIVP